uniref:Putative secreted protein n=1 Tax=Anopheles marajoara TaxID=58244 RepID=A0A2M4CFN4_9DIPT
MTMLSMGILIRLSRGEPSFGDTLCVAFCVAMRWPPASNMVEAHTLAHLNWTNKSLCTNWPTEGKVSCCA